MADTVYQKFDAGTQTWKPVKLHDNGDGTWSEIAAATDVGPSWTSLHKVINSADMSGAGIAKIIDDPAAGLKFVLTDIIISVATAMNVTLKEETGGAVLGGPYYLGANSTLQITTRSKWIKTTVATDAIQALASVAGNVTIETLGYTEA